MNEKKSKGYKTKNLQPIFDEAKNMNLSPHFTNRSPRPWEANKSSTCCSRGLVVIIVLIFSILIIALCAAVIYLKLELDLVKDAAAIKRDSFNDRNAKSAKQVQSIDEDNVTIASETTEIPSERQDSEGSTTRPNDEPSANPDPTPESSKTTKDNRQQTSSGRDSTDEHQTESNSESVTDEYTPPENPTASTDRSSGFDVETSTVTSRQTTATSRKPTTEQRTTVGDGRNAKEQQNTEPPTERNTQGTSSTRNNEQTKATETPTKKISVIPSESGVFTTTTSEILNVSLCPPDLFQCRSGSCIQKSEVCDELVDCDGSEPTDEINCTCSARLRERQCDFVYDCPDGSDEVGCRGCAQTAPNHCVNNECTRFDFVCDGVNDCPARRGSDERNCTKISPNFDQDHLYRNYRSGYLMHRAGPRWYPVCYSGTARDDRSFEPRELTSLVDACSAFLGYRESNVTLERVLVEIIGRNFSKYIKYNSLTETRLTEGCESGIAVHTSCPLNPCPVDGSDVRPTFDQFTEISKPRQWPWHAALFRNGQFFCGAVLLNDRWFLTAAKCFSESNSGGKSYYEAITGSVRYTSFVPYETVHAVDSIIIHDDYSTGSEDDGIALFKVKDIVEFSDHLKAICLPRDNKHVPTPFSQCKIFGWGDLINHNPPHDELWDVEFPVDASCEDPKNICPGNRTDYEGTCREEIGGPIACLHKDSFGQQSWYLAGVTVEPAHCQDRSVPGRFLKISEYLSWINENVESTETVRPLDSCPGRVCKSLSGGMCVTSEAVCNKIVDCSDASDETNC